jgi:hypothetical protein
VGVPTNAAKEAESQWTHGFMKMHSARFPLKARRRNNELNTRAGFAGEPEKNLQRVFCAARKLLRRSRRHCVRRRGGAAFPTWRAYGDS